MGSPVTEFPREPGAVVWVPGQSEHRSVPFPPAGSVARSCSEETQVGILICAFEVKKIVSKQIILEISFVVEAWD